MVFNNGNCSAIPDATETDAGVAGAGTLLSFIITNFLSICLSGMIIILDKRRSVLCRKLLQSFSDQQILTGIGIQSVGLAKINNMVPYHFFIIWLLSLLSTVTNLSTLIALVDDFKRDWVLRWIRQLLMLVNMLLGIMFGIFILQSVTKGMNPRVPIGCVWEVPNNGSSSKTVLSVVGTLAIIVLEAAVFIIGTWYLCNRTNPGWMKTVQIVSLAVLFATGVGATVRVVMVSQAFGSPPKALNLVGPSEASWSFGQLLPLLLLVLPIISLIEITRGEMNVPLGKTEDETLLLASNTEPMGGFQPHSMGKLFSRK